MENEFVKCDRCNGTGTMLLTGFISRDSGCFTAEREPMKCVDCSGSGHISKWTLKMRRIGKFIREGRHELDLTLREQAKLLGMSLTELNNLERGRGEE